MGEKKYDRELGIRTEGLREWGGTTEYNRYEATPYKALDALFKSYRFKKNQRVVDFGCGRGRVTFAIHDKFKVPITGIEAHDQTFGEALVNQERYLFKTRQSEIPVNLEYGLAEDYQIHPEENCFYFFNPFSVDVFAQVMDNIMTSLKANPRTIDVILYYPLAEFKTVMEGHSFRLINKIDVPSLAERREKFLIYRFSPIVKKGKSQNESA